MKIGVVGFNTCLMVSLSGIYELFSIADHLRGRVKEWVPEFSVNIVTDERKTVAVSGFHCSGSCSYKEAVSFDWIVVPAHIGGLDMQNEKLVSFLKEAHRAGAKIGTVCAGVQFLAETGLLDGKKATTHWNLVVGLEERYPDVKWCPHQMLVDEHSIVTAGGIMAWQELALYIIGRELSMELASLVSKMMLIDANRELQSPYEIVDVPIARSDTVIAESQQWLHRNFSQKVTLDELAERANLVKRTYVRRFKSAAYCTPIVYLQELRLNEAKRLLETSSLSFEAITEGVGYSDVNSFRTLFVKQNGISPSLYRKRFSLVLP